MKHWGLCNMHNLRHGRHKNIWRTRHGGTRRGRNALLCRPVETERRTELAAVVREQRLARRLTMKRAAELAGIGRSTWYAIESGKRTETYAGTLDKIDMVLELAPGTLRAIVEAKPAPPGNVLAMRQRLAMHASTLTPAALSAALAFIEHPDTADAAALQAIIIELDGLRERVSALTPKEVEPWR